MLGLINLYKESFSGLSRGVWSLAALSLINRIGSMVILFLSLYLTQELGWSKIDAGFIFAAFGCGSMAGAWLGGYLADIFGNFKIMLSSLILGGLGYIFMAYIESFHILLVWAFLTSLSTDLFRAPLYASAADFSDESSVTRAISLLRLTFNLGIAIGPAIGGFVAGIYGYYWLFIMDGSTCILAGLFMFFFLRNQYGAHVKTKEAISNVKTLSPYKDVVFLSFMFFCFLNLITFFQIISTIPLYLKEVLSIGEKGVGWFFTVNGLLIFVFEMPIILKLEKRGSVMNSVILGALMTGISHMFLNIPMSGLVPFILYTLFVSFGEIISFPFFTSIGVKRSNKSNQGQYIGIVALMFSMAYIVGPFLGMWLVDNYGFTTLWNVMGMIGLGSTIGLIYSKMNLSATDN